ncbi:hypothetical protein [Actinoplanes sp. DH11]|uniref:hypothetical protein n=1 Tax=Actinoplanes sp. DH11 TaxID=2857011 RepID=UPI001E308856|nr:hypothetical protein [Actinoplanes sp. DH11]
MLQLLNRPEYADLAPAQVWARELDEGRWWCSESTMYRILRAAGQTGERRAQATHPTRTKPELVADAANQRPSRAGGAPAPSRAGTCREPQRGLNEPKAARLPGPTSARHPAGGAA